MRFYLFPSGYIGDSFIENDRSNTGRGSYTWSYNSYERHNGGFYPNTKITQGGGGGGLAFSVWGSYDVETKKIKYLIPSIRGLYDGTAFTGILKSTIYYDNGRIGGFTTQARDVCETTGYQSTSDSSSGFLRPGETLTTTRSGYASGLGYDDLYFSATLSQ